MNAKSFAISIALAAGLVSTAQASDRIVTLETVQVRPSAEQIAQRQHELASDIPTLAAVQVRPTVGQVVELANEQAARESVVTVAAVEVRPSAEQRRALAAETASQGTDSVGSAAIAAALAQLSAVLPAVRPVPVHLHGLVVEAAAQLVKH